MDACGNAAGLLHWSRSRDHAGPGETDGEAAVAALAEGVIQMTWLARPKPPVAVAAALFLATAGVAVQGRQQPAPEGAREQAKTAPPLTGGAAVSDVAANRALAREQLVLIEDALAALHQLARDARITLADPSFSLWGRRRLETLRKTGAGKAEIVAALEKHINSLKVDEAITEELHRRARATQVDVYDVRFRRIEAEIWLNEEKAR
jgi:hypothetical protein